MELLAIVSELVPDESRSGSETFIALRVVTLKLTLFGVRVEMRLHLRKSVKLLLASRKWAVNFYFLRLRIGVRFDHVLTEIVFSRKAPITNLKHVY